MVFATENEVESSADTASLSLDLEQVANAEAKKCVIEQITGF